MDVISGLDTSGYREMLESCAMTAPLPAACLFFSGGDALEWIHGQVTQEIVSMAPGDFREACLCSATGHILSIMSIASLPGRVVMTMPMATAGSFVQRVETSVFLEDVQVEWGPHTWVPVLIQGPGTLRMLVDHGLDSPARAFDLPGGRGVVQRMCFTGDGVMIWADPSDPLMVSIRETVPIASPEMTNALRLEMGYPQWGTDIREKTLPPEMGAKFLERTVSFSKGCYTGQEVLMRIHARGHVNRQWMALLCERPVKAGSLLKSDLREQAGVVTSTAVSPDFGALAGAMVHRDAAISGTAVTVLQDGEEVRAELRELPLRR